MAEIEFPQITEGECSKLPPEELEELFFSGPGQPSQKPAASTQAMWDMAKEVCLECPLMLPCRDSSWGQEYGVWGGIDPYERYLARKRRLRRLERAPEEERLALGERIFRMNQGGGGLSMAAVSRVMGYGIATCNKLLHEYQAHLKEARKAERKAAQMERAAKSPLVLASNLQPFPQGAPVRRHGNAWCRYYGGFLPAHYVAQTADGLWIRLKIKSNGMPIIRWFPAGDVQLRTGATPVIEDWKNRTDRAGSDAPEGADSREPAA